MLDQLISCHDERDNSTEYGRDEFFKSFIMPKNLPASQQEGDNMSDTGGSSSYNYGHVAKLESHAHMVRFDQQMMGGLSNNMTEHPLFLSTPRFISDLLFVSEVLKGIEKDDRNAYLAQVIGEMNKCLPANVYIPIRQASTNVPKRHSKKRRNGRIGETQMHRVLRISTENAFCLHSKERVPYHIVIEVAHDTPSREDEMLDLTARETEVNRTQKVHRHSNDLWKMGKNFKKRLSGGLNVPDDGPIEMQRLPSKGFQTQRSEDPSDAEPFQRSTMNKQLLPQMEEHTPQICLFWLKQEKVVQIISILY